MSLKNKIIHGSECKGRTAYYEASDVDDALQELKDLINERAFVMDEFTKNRPVVETAWCMKWIKEVFVSEN